MTPRLPLLCLAVALASGCGGTWSNKDLEFVNALPTKDALRSNLPSKGTASSGLASVGTRQDGLNVGDPSAAYARTKQASTDFNGLVDFLLNILDTVRASPPSSRGKDSRTWGPYSDAKNPGAQFRLTITQVDTEHFAWVIQLQPKGGAWIDAVTGNFKATTTVREGEGAMVVHVKDFRDALAIGGELRQLDEIQIGYLTDQDPRRTSLVFTVAPGSVSGLSSIGYTAVEAKDGSGAMDFLFKKPLDLQVSALRLSSRWNTVGAGVAKGVVEEGAYAGATVTECWDAKFTVTYYAESWPSGQTSGKPSDCVMSP